LKCTFYIVHSAFCGPPNEEVRRPYKSLVFHDPWMNEHPPATEWVQKSIISAISKWLDCYKYPMARVNQGLCIQTLTFFGI
jgi:hypothetical protein